MSKKGLGLSNFIEEFDVKTKLSIDKKRKTLAIIFVFIIVNINSIIAARVYQYVKISELKYTISHLKNKDTKVRRELEKLKLKKSKLNSVSRIEKIAKEKLKMVKNKQNVIYYNSKL